MTSTPRILDAVVELEPEAQRLVRHWRALPENERLALLQRVEVASVCLYMAPAGDRDPTPIAPKRSRAVKRRG